MWGHCGAWAHCMCVSVCTSQNRGWAGGDREDHPAPTPLPWAAIPCSRAGYSGTPGPSLSTVMGGDTRCVLVCFGVCVSAHARRDVALCVHTPCLCLCPVPSSASHKCVHAVSVEGMALLTASRMLSAFPAEDSSDCTG